MFFSPCRVKVRYEDFTLVSKQDLEVSQNQPEGRHRR